MSDETVIQSLTERVTLKDHLHWAFLGRAAWKCAIIVPVIFFLFLLILEILGDDPVTAEFILIDALYPSIVVLVMIFVWTALIVFLGHRRLEEDQRIARWTFSQTTVTVTDKAGNAISRPWSQVSAVRYSVKGVRIYYKPVGSMWIATKFMPNEKTIKLKAMTKKLGLS